MTRRGNGESTIYLGGDGSWHGRVTMGVLDNGKPDRRHRTAQTEVEIKRKVKALEKERDAGTVTKPGRGLTVEKWLTYWLENIAARKVAPSTLEGYESKVRHRLIPGLGAHRLDRLEPEHVETFYGKCEDEGLAPATVLQLHRILSRALKVAVQRGKVNRNVCQLVDAPSRDQVEVDALTKAEARALLQAAGGVRNSARWSVALALGLRQGEALGLTWSDVDLADGQIRIREQLQRRRWRHGCTEPCGKRRGADCPQRHSGGLVKKSPKSRAGRRTIVLPEQLAEAMRAHYAAQCAEKGLAGELWQKQHDLVFAQADGRPVDPRRDWGDWKALLAIAGVRDARLHDARHTAATLLMAAGVPARVVMEMLGHSQISLTLGTYSHVAPELETEAATRMNMALWGEQ